MLLRISSHSDLIWNVKNILCWPLLRENDAYLVDRRSWRNTNVTFSTWWMIKVIMLRGNETMVGKNKPSCGKGEVRIPSTPTIKDFHQVTPATINYTLLVLFSVNFKIVRVSVIRNFILYRNEFLWVNIEYTCSSLLLFDSRGDMRKLARDLVWMLNLFGFKNACIFQIKPWTVLDLAWTLSNAW
jgi:hypothetical protein